MVMTVIMLALPAAIATLLVAKIPKPGKDLFYKVPPWLSSILISLIIAPRFVHGVMAPYAVGIMDICLWPILELMKKRHMKKYPVAVEGESSMTNFLGRFNQNRLGGTNVAGS